MTSQVPQLGALLANRYRVIRTLGEGGMGAVYEAENTVTFKRVAVKWMHPHIAGDPAAAERFVREAQASSRVRHPNIVDVYDILRDGEGVFLVMELLEGMPLSTYLARGDYAIPGLLALLIPAMKAVAAAHKHGIIHRDIKPDNIFLAQHDGAEGFVPKVLDFGISKVRGGEDMQLTRTGVAMGTPLYMSLEQLTGSKDVDQRTDIYAFGVILYQAVTGRMPFEAETFTELAVKLATTTPPAPEALRPDIPIALARLIQWAMATQRENRVGSLDALIQELEPFALEGFFRRQVAEQSVADGDAGPSLDASSRTDRAAGVFTGHGRGSDRGGAAASPATPAGAGALAQSASQRGAHADSGTEANPAQVQDTAAHLGAELAFRGRRAKTLALGGLVGLALLAGGVASALLGPWASSSGAHGERAATAPRLPVLPEAAGEPASANRSRQRDDPAAGGQPLEEASDHRRAPKTRERRDERRERNDLGSRAPSKSASEPSDARKPALGAPTLAARSATELPLSRRQTGESAPSQQLTARATGAEVARPTSAEIARPTSAEVARPTSAEVARSANLGAPGPAEGEPANTTSLSAAASAVQPANERQNAARAPASLGQPASSPKPDGMEPASPHASASDGAHAPAAAVTPTSPPQARAASRLPTTQYWRPLSSDKLSQSEEHQQIAAMLRMGPPYRDVAAAKQAYKQRAISKETYSHNIWVLKYWRKHYLIEAKQALKAGTIDKAQYRERVQHIDRVYAGR